MSIINLPAYVAAIYGARSGHLGGTYKPFIPLVQTSIKPIRLICARRLRASRSARRSRAETSPRRSLATRGGAA